MQKAAHIFMAAESNNPKTKAIMKKQLITPLLLVLWICGSASAATQATLYSGQDWDVGTVTVCNDDVNLYIQVDLDGPDAMAESCITEIAIDVVMDPADFPTTKSGNPKVGHFEYGMGYDCAVSPDAIVIPLAEVGASAEDVVYIAVHATIEYPEEVLVDGIPTIVTMVESAWADGARFNEKGNWATFMSYAVEEYYCTLTVDILVNGIYSHKFVLDVYPDGTASVVSGEFLGGGGLTPFDETVTIVEWDPDELILKLTATYPLGSHHPGYTWYPEVDLDATDIAPDYKFLNSLSGIRPVDTTVTYSLDCGNCE